MKNNIKKEDIFNLMFNFTFNECPELSSIQEKLSQEEWKNLSHILFQLSERYTMMTSPTVDSLEYNNAKKLNWWRCLTVAISTFVSTTFFTIMIWIINIILGTN